METLLDKIAEGDIGWRKVIDNFYGSFKLDVERAEEEMEKLKLKMNLLAKIVKFVALLWLLKWDDMVSLWRAQISQTVEIRKQS